MPVSVSRRSLLKASGLTAAAVSMNGAASAVASAATKDINVQHPIRNIEHVRAFYKNFPTRLAAVRKGFNRPLTLSEKILYTHLYHIEDARDFKRGHEFANFRPDQLVMEDLTAQSAMQQFLVAEFPKVQLPSSIHCDHLTLTSLRNL